MAVKLYQYQEDFGRMGELTSTFLMDEYAFASMEGFEVWLDEPLGKHSELEVLIGGENWSVKEISEEVVQILYDIFPDGHLGGLDFMDLAVEQKEEQGE